MTPEIAAQLRKPFDAKHIKYIQKGGARLAYVGHAQITDRLLAVDPMWNWEPAALTPEGLPLFDELGGIWIKLTVCGVTRLGYGDAQGKKGPNAIKEAIGDGLRNAAMRFGVALDLWGASCEDDITSAATPESDPAIVKELTAVIQTAENKDDLANAWRAVNGAEKNGSITTPSADELRGIWNQIKSTVLVDA